MQDSMSEIDSSIFFISGQMVQHTTLTILPGAQMFNLAKYINTPSACR